MASIQEQDGPNTQFRLVKNMNSNSIWILTRKECQMTSHSLHGEPKVQSLSKFTTDNGMLLPKMNFLMLIEMIANSEMMKRKSRVLMTTMAMTVMMVVMVVTAVMAVMAVTAVTAVMAVTATVK